MNKIEHLGIAVKDMEQSIRLYEQLLNTPCYKKEEVESEGVLTAFFRTGESKIELLQGVKEGNAISSFIEKRGEGLHHVAFDVDDIYAEMERLKSAGFRLIHDEPKEGADGKLIAFIHPKSANGVLVEICMDKNKR